jgi:hypothetical protein
MKGVLQQGLAAFLPTSRACLFERQAFRAKYKKKLITFLSFAVFEKIQDRHHVCISELVHIFSNQSWCPESTRKLLSFILDKN